MITPCYYPVKGGTETVVRNLSIALNKNNIQTDVMTFNMDHRWNPKWQGKIEKTDEITVFKIPALNWLPIAHSPRITMGINLIPSRFTQILKQYDIIHFHEAEFSFPLFSHFVKKPKILHLHGISFDYLKRYHLSRFILKTAADLYLSITKQMKNELIMLGIPKNKITYLPNGVNTDLFSPQKRKEDDLLLFVGRIAPNKGLHVLLKSLSYLKKSIRLVIIGPADWNLEYYQNMLNLIESENRKKKHEIRYLGTLEQADIIKWHQKASIFILPSFEEGLPVTTLEALSCGTPVIATPVGGIPEVVKNRENGLLVPQNDPFKLAETIQFLLENEDMRIRFGHEGRELVVKDFSLKVVVSKLSRIYEQMLNSFNS
jgi:glycosyltransferase involved in cell wall biosynthesis